MGKRDRSKNRLNKNQVEVIKDFNKTRRVQIAFKAFLSSLGFILIIGFYYVIIHIADYGIVEGSDTIIETFIKSTTHLLYNAAIVLTSTGYYFERRGRKKLIKTTTELRKALEGDDSYNSSSGLNRYR